MGRKSLQIKWFRRKKWKELTKEEQNDYYRIYKDSLFGVYEVPHEYIKHCEKREEKEKGEL